MTQDQYHHYIPRFILKGFADVTLPRLGARKDHHIIKVYGVRDETLTMADVSRAYGIMNMYRDLGLDDYMHFEKLLGKLESSSAVFVHAIRSGSKDLLLKRVDLVNFKKFLAIMMYRHENRRRQYVEDMFDPLTRVSVQRHMRSNNIGTIQEVWLENLKGILQTSVDDIFNAAMTIIQDQNRLRGLLAYKGRIHSTELLEVEDMISNYVCIWQAQEGSEFIITDNCFGCFEGHNGVNFHNFFVVSPQYAVVLVNRLYMWGGMEQLPLRTSWFGEELHANPDCDYIKKGVQSFEDYDPNDVFKYRRIIVPKDKVWLVNSIFLDARHKHITYRSAVGMIKTLAYYDKHKRALFPNSHDYSALKRHLAAEINRTHAL
ncbi:hypothetical protein BGZ68_003723 [Mortierella alpina]|nr:hypothetical protein BGZ68_003723 [Mortierella alpina]